MTPDRPRVHQNSQISHRVRPDWEQHKLWTTHPTNIVNKAEYLISKCVGNTRCWKLPGENNFISNREIPLAE
eukprot:2536213-Pleurochrysis_carterae.AAC.1